MVTPLQPAHVFDDILDGYFPLGESLNQCLVRNGFAAALIVLTHAPILDLPDRPGNAPVPLRLGSRRSGLIRRLMVRANLDAGSLSGVGRWRWHDDTANRALTSETRLAEPAFVRGIGVKTLPLPDATLWHIDGPRGHEAWGFRPGLPGLLGEDAARVFIADHAPGDEVPRLQTTGDTAPLARDWRL